MIPTPKRKVLTKTTSNTVGDAPTTPASTTPLNDTVQNVTATPTDAKAATSDAAQGAKTSKQAPGELPTSSDEYVLSFFSTNVVNSF